MEERRASIVGRAVGAGIGALLAGVLFAYLALGLKVFCMALEPAIGAVVIGMILGAVLGWALSRPRPTVEQVLGVPTTRGTKIVTWVAAVMALAFALNTGVDGQILGALGWLSLAASWTLQASGAAERTRPLLSGSGVAFLMGILAVGTGLILNGLVGAC
jgi:hypothetical protein